MNRMDEYTALLAELKQAPEELNHTVNKALDRKVSSSCWVLFWHLWV